MLTHIKDAWANHIAAGSATGMSLLNGSTMIQSIIVGVAVYLITHVLSAAYHHIKGKIKP